VPHDAEDVVHSAELRVLDCLIERFDLVQLPLLPLIDAPPYAGPGAHALRRFLAAPGRTWIPPTRFRR